MVCGRNCMTSFSWKKEGTQNIEKQYSLCSFSLVHLKVQMLKKHSTPNFWCHFGLTNYQALENFSFWRRDVIKNSLVKDKKIRVLYTRKWFWNALHSSTLLWTYLTIPISKPQVFFVWSLQQFWNWTCVNCTMFFFPINLSLQWKVPLCQATVLTCGLHTLKRVFISFPKYT